MIIGGLLIALIGIAAWLFSGNGSSEPPAATEGSTIGLSTSTSQPSTATTTGEPTTTSTTVAITTPTTIDASGAIQSFVPMFADAIAREDVEFLLGTLHPSVFTLFDEETCRTFISDEILLLDQYRLIGDVDGPTAQLVAEMEVEMFQAPVAFAFQGQEFTSEAAFALVEGQVRWFTQCGSG